MTHPDDARTDGAQPQLDEQAAGPGEKISTDCHFLRYPPGHFYSPLPSRQEASRALDRMSGQEPDLAGVDLREKEQLRLFGRLSRWYDEMPFKRNPQPGMRYYFDNPAYSYADAFFLYAMMREFRPRRIVEVGSGYSSSVMLDTNDLFLDGATRFHFIEPYPASLLSLIHDADRKIATIHNDRVQNVPLDIFASLNAGDFLFIDSSHVGKLGSDVLHLLHTVLPLLKPGVFIHFHDIFYPFQYPREWTENGIAWNECYFLHAFLQYNTAFTIALFGHFLAVRHPAMIEKSIPICARNTGGSLWLEKIR